MSWLIQLKKIKDVVLFEAKALFEKLDENETALMTILWNTILQTFIQLANICSLLTVQ